MEMQGIPWESWEFHGNAGNPVEILWESQKYDENFRSNKKHE
jgi:hypothetical protein